MRALSPHGNYSIQLFEGREQVVTDARGYGGTVVLDKPVVADFEQGGLMDHEIEAALEMFNFSGLPDGVNPLTRISVFDTEAYVLARPNADAREDLLRKMDARLRDLQFLNPNEFIIVEPPFTPRPWPSYDDDSVEDILKVQQRLEWDAEHIRKYEEENKQRQDVIAAMRTVEDPTYSVATESVPVEQPHVERPAFGSVIEDEAPLKEGDRIAEVNA